MGWVNIPASNSLAEEVNWLAPERDKGADGTVGDLAHAQGSSDHNPDDTPGITASGSDTDKIPEVHARDVDSTGPWPSGWSMERIVQIIVSRHKSGADSRLQNVIYNRRIWSRSWGWTQRAYTGPDPHTGHAHFSFRYGSGSGTSNPENVTSAWGIRAAREAEMALDANDLNNVRKIVNEEVARFVGDVVHRYVITDGKVLIVPETDSNPRMMASSALQYIFQAVLQNQVALASLGGQIDNVDEAVVAQLGTVASPQQKADLLRAALGADAAAVGRLLASV